MLSYAVLSDSVLSYAVLSDSVIQCSLVFSILLFLFKPILLTCIHPLPYSLFNKAFNVKPK